MSVYVTLLPTAIPPDYLQDAERDVSYEDRLGEGEDNVEYQYSVHASGALTVWRCFSDAPPIADTTFGPAAWERVQGKPHRSL